MQPPPAGTANHAPVINSTPPSKITEDSTRTYQIKASDPDGDNLSYGVQKLSGATVSGAGKVTWTAPAVSQDSTIKGVTYLVSDGTDTTRQSADLTVKYVQPQPKPPVVDLTKMIVDEMSTGKFSLPDTATNGDKVSYLSATNNSAYLSTSLNSNEVDYKAGKVNQDEKGSISLNVKDNKTGLTNSQNLEVKVMDHVDKIISVADFKNMGVKKPGVGEVGIDSAGVYVPYNNIVVLNGKKLTDSIGRTAFETGSNNEAEIMLKDRTDSLLANNYMGLWIKMGEGKLINYPAADAYGYGRNMKKYGIVQVFVDAPAPSGSFVGKVFSKFKDGQKVVGVIPYNNVVGYQNALYNPNQANSFFAWTNSAGGLIKNNVNNVSLVKYNPQDTVHFDKKEIDIAKKVIEGLSNSRVNAGGKSLNIYQDSVQNSNHSGKGWWVINPVKPGSKPLHYNNNFLATTNEDISGGVENGAHTWIEYDLDTDAPAQDSTTIEHEGALAVEGFSYEVVNNNWSNKTIAETSTKLTSPGAIDSYWMDVIFNPHFKAGEDQSRFSNMTFNYQDF
ncbi:MAG TPA: Ig-like domain-containing protein [Bacteroidales bacterium]|nr:Ig-like domain-containing protein [Bacteroidales bacterium]